MAIGVRARWITVALLAMCWAVRGGAEIIRTGETTALTGAMIVAGDAGTTVGTNPANLFHSFSVFNVNAGEAALFTAPTNGATVANIINRVTGSGGSAINGLIQSNVFGADVYLFNPNGVAIGPQARLDISGAFYFSSAESVHLADGGVFHADVSAASTLTSASPASFGFGASPEPVTVAGGLPINNLAPTETIGLVGGDVTLDGRALLASSNASQLGRIDLVSVASPGQVAIGPAPPDLSGFERLGDVTLRGESLVDGKEVYIRGGRFVIEDASVSPGAFSLLFNGPPSPDGGRVDVAVRGEMRVDSTIRPRPGLNLGAGAGVPAGIYAFSDTSNGDVPTISISAGALTLTGRGGTTAGAPFAGIVSERFGQGGRGGITVEAGRVEIRNGAQLSSINHTSGGRGPDVSIAATDVLLSGDGALDFTGVAAQAQTFSQFVTDAGGLTLTAETLSVRSGAEISNESFTLGRGGDVTITAGRLVGNRDGAATGGITSQSAIAGDAGTMTVDVGTLELGGGFQISNSVAGVGDAGALTVRATEAIVLSGENTGLFSSTRDTRIEDVDRLAAFFGTTGQALLGFFGGTVEGLLTAGGIPNTPGKGGVIAIDAPSLRMSGDSRIDTSTFGAGPGGAIEATIDRVEIRDSALIRSQSGGIERGTGTLVVGPGAGGRVSLTSETITLAGKVGSKPAGLSTTTRGIGDGGSIDVRTDQLTMRDGAAITSESLTPLADLLTAPPGSGEAGPISVRASDRVVMRSASISTASANSGGGDIVMRIGELLSMEDATITTSAGESLASAPANVQAQFLREGGSGEALFLGGGDIDIDPVFVVLNRSTITADAFAGDGGNITIVAQHFLTDPSSLIQARSDLRQDGNIVIDSPDDDVRETLVALPQTFFDASSALQGLCEARRAGGLGNSLVVRGHGGVPPAPEGYLGSVPMIADVSEIGGREIVAGTPPELSGLALAWPAITCR